MWKKLSFKKQIILILLIPVSGLLYFTISDINESYQKLARIDNTTTNIDRVVEFSQAIMLINNERTLLEYSKLDPTKKAALKLEMSKTDVWLSKITSTDSIVLKNVDEARLIMTTLHENIKTNSLSSIQSFTDYSRLNNIFNNLIGREIVNCENTNLAKAANNLKAYIHTKSVANLIRVIVFYKLTDDTIVNNLKQYYDNEINTDSNTNFNLVNFNTLKANDEIIEFKNSAAFKSFLATSESIINNRSKISPKAWWTKSTIDRKSVV